MLFFKGRSRSRDTDQIFKKLLFHQESLERAQENIQKTLKSILSVVGAEAGSLFTFQKSRNLFTLQQWVGERPLHVSISGDYEFVKYLKQVQRAVFKDEVLSDLRFADIRAAGAHYFSPIAAVAAVPLMVKGEWLGILNVGRGEGPLEHDEEDRTLLMFLGNWLSHHMTNAALYAEIKTQNRKLSEISQLKTQLMANITHELRTPLNGILGLTDLLLDGSDGPVNPDQRKHLDMIKDAGDTLLGIINNILSLVKVEASKGEIEIKKLDLSRMTAEVGDLFKSAFEAQRNRFHVHLNEAFAVYGNEDQVRTVLMNLVGNAAKFTRNGQVEILASRNGEMVRVCVKDTGIGLSEDDQNRIFDEFQQADGTLTRSYGGTGLGLTIAKKIIEQHGGRMWVDSVLGKGSEFYFTLPLRPTGIKASEVA